jgi:hypothetical protein
MSWRRRRRGGLLQLKSSKPPMISCNRNPMSSNNFASTLSILWSWIHYFIGTIYLTKMSKQEKIQKLTKAVTSNWEPEAVEEWTAEDEGRLQQLKCAEVNLEDTALGRKKALIKQKFHAVGVDN